MPTYTANKIPYFPMALVNTDIHGSWTRNIDGLKDMEIWSVIQNGEQAYILSGHEEEEGYTYQVFDHEGTYMQELYMMGFNLEFKS